MILEELDTLLPFDGFSTRMEDFVDGVVVQENNKYEYKIRLDFEIPSPNTEEFQEFPLLRSAIFSEIISALWEVVTYGDKDSSDVLRRTLDGSIKRGEQIQSIHVKGVAIWSHYVPALGSWQFTVYVTFDAKWGHSDERPVSDEQVAVATAVQTAMPKSRNS